MRVLVIGRTEILYETTQLLVRYGHEIVGIVTAKEAPEYTRGVDDFAQLANQLNIPILCSSRISKHLPILCSLNVDIAVSINYPKIIPSNVIDIFPHGILNAHGGDLPRYRGNACQAWAILNGEERIGLCIHKMIGGELDSGNIIAREYLDINHQTKVTQTWEWMKKRVPHLFLEAIAILSEDPSYVLEKQSTAPEDALRCYPRCPEDGRIDWQQSAIQVLRLINASNKPYAGAFCEFGSKKMIIWDGEIVDDDEEFCAVPGQITDINQQHMDIACGEGKLRIKRFEIEGELGKPKDWFKSIRQRLT